MKETMEEEKFKVRFTGQALRNMIVPLFLEQFLLLMVGMSVAWNVLTFALTPLFLNLYALEPATKTLVIYLVLLHNTFSAFVFPYAGALGNGLRATGDVRYTMVVAIASTVGGRFILAYIFGVVLNGGVMGVAVAMCMDWVIRALCYIWRQRSGRWQAFQVI